MNAEFGANDFDLLGELRCIENVGLCDVQRWQDVVNPPRITGGADERVHFVPLVDQRARDVRADETRCACE